MTHTWFYDDDLAVLHLKLKYGGKVSVFHSAVVSLSQAIDVTQPSIVVRKRNFDFLETGSGTSHAAEETKIWQAKVWNDYLNDPEFVASQARDAYTCYVSRLPLK